MSNILFHFRCVSVVLPAGLITINASLLFQVLHAGLDLLVDNVLYITHVLYSHSHPCCPWCTWDWCFGECDAGSGVRYLSLFIHCQARYFSDPLLLLCLLESACFSYISSIRLYIWTCYLSSRYKLYISSNRVVPLSTCRHNQVDARPANLCKLATPPHLSHHWHQHPTSTHFLSHYLCPKFTPTAALVSLTALPEATKLLNRNYHSPPLFFFLNVHNSILAHDPCSSSIR